MPEKKSPRAAKPGAQPSRAAAAAPRRRRTAAVARDEILDAAERRLARSGPEGIRLKEIAADVGISHPTLLHHFGNRQGLVEALAERTMSDLANDLIDAIAAPDVIEGAPAALERVYRVLGDTGHARLLVWRALAGWTKRSGIEGRLLWSLIDALHARRTEIFQARNDEPPAYRDTAFTALIAVFATLGEAVVGGLFLSEVSGGARPTRRAFRAWLVDRVLERLVGESPIGFTASREARASRA